MELRELQKEEKNSKIILYFDGIVCTRWQDEQKKFASHVSRYKHATWIIIHRSSNFALLQFDSSIFFFFRYFFVPSSVAIDGFVFLCAFFPYFLFLFAVRNANETHHEKKQHTQTVHSLHSRQVDRRTMLSSSSWFFSAFLIFALAFTDSKSLSSSLALWHRTQSNVLSLPSSITIRFHTCFLASLRRRCYFCITLAIPLRKLPKWYTRTSDDGEHRKIKRKKKQNCNEKENRSSN